MKIICLIFTLLIIIPAAGADEFVMPKSLRMALPLDGSVKIEWIAPPLAESQVKKANLQQQRFHLDSHGAAWVCYNQKYLADFSSGFSFSLKQSIRDFVFLTDNALFLLTDKSLGTVAPFSQDKLNNKEIPELLFQPICGLPIIPVGLIANDQDKLFIFGFDSQIREYAVYELLSDFSSWRKIFVSSQRILAAVADNDIVYIASGRMVFQVPLKADQAEKIVFSHPLEMITALTQIKGVGIFYATASGVGLVNGQGSLEFMKSQQPQIVAWQDQLYIFFPESLGILRLTNPNRLTSK
ncbi:MAG: hypothetical protein KJ915_04175 [Candidatus Omnitrophica bacterium]|nr:hypothetical protein [Candidatus Omnitrophota bacterium]